MFKGIWETIEKPMMLLAPMEDVTDNAFREMFARHGKPDAMYTEFTSADGLMSVGRDRVIHRFEYNDNQRPIIAQIFSKNPDMMRKVTELCVRMGFDGVDINMGCPKDNICRNSGGCGMIKEPKLAQKVIQAAQEGADNKIAVSVKTRLGYYNRDEYKEWVPRLLEMDIPKLTMHFRTKKDMSKVPADWNYATKVREIRDKMSPDTILVGNGDIKSIEEAYQLVSRHKIDGAMIGRGIFGNPWFFNKKKNKEDLSQIQILEALLEHVDLYEKYFGDRKNFQYMRKHFKAYIYGFQDAKQLRMKLVKTNSANEVRQVVKEYISEI